MGLSTSRAALSLTNLEKEKLKKMSNSQTLPKREVQRSKVLLLYSENHSISSIQRLAGLSRPSIYKCIDKALAGGITMGLKDKYHRPKPPTITAQAKAWVISLACSKPKEHGYAAELWSYSSLANHVRRHAQSAGHPSLSKAVKASVYRILKSHPIQPHKVNYYLEKKDLEFDRKMKEVLLVYQEVGLQNKNKTTKEDLEVITISVDEKPGVQALKNTAPDLPPKKGKSKRWSRDYEYQRLGTLSIMAALDLHDGHVICQVKDRHRSKEFIELLEEVDQYYPKNKIIRIILDNHSSHISKETMKYLQSKPNRFQYVHTPKHGSWLNIIETLFSKMARTFLKKIRVSSLEELKKRIVKGVEEINNNPVVHRWGKFEKLKNS